MSQQPLPPQLAGVDEQKRRLARPRPPPLNKIASTAPPAEKSFLDKTIMGEGRYSALFKASSFELFVPKNKVRCRNEMLSLFKVGVCSCRAAVGSFLRVVVRRSRARRWRLVYAPPTPSFSTILPTVVFSVVAQ
jgi:hypothetical protein